MMTCAKSATPLVDRYHRSINYLRLSITDRCNFRCVYCMPEQGVTKCSHSDILSFEQLLLVARAAIGLGIGKIRITGGEPLVRKGVLPFVRRLRRLSGLEQLVLTTNGFNLKEMAKPLRDAGVERLNISLDSLKPERFARISRIGALPPVWDGILKATALGLPIKLNVVVLRGVNDDELLDFVALTQHYNWCVRFIEYMPNAQGSHKRWWVPADEIYARISRVYALEPIAHSHLSGPATTYHVQGAQGTVGIISALSCSFCSWCNRIRVTSTGGMRNCLFSPEELDLKPFLDTMDLTALMQAMEQNILQKPPSHNLCSHPAQRNALLMSQVGG